MKKYSIILMAATASVVLLFTQCKKTDLALAGTASTADFAFAQSAASDTLPYPYNVTFTNNSKEEFLYQWSFGDNTDLSSSASPVHTYKIGGTYNVKLTTVGTNGSNSISKVVVVKDACQNDFFNKLTNCSSGQWTWSSDGDAIKVLSADGTQQYFAGAPAACQADDVYKFSTDGTFQYDANGQTFDVQSGYNCVAPKSNAVKYKIIAKANTNPVIVLDSLPGSVNKPFIGTTDIIKNNSYTVMSYTASNMVLRSTLSDGALLEVKLKKVVVLTISDIKNLLTGATSKGWKLDNTPGANTIIVGTEASPSQYFAGGPIDGCQADDVYTFSANNTLTYNANGSTFNGGNVGPNYTCGDDRSYSKTFTFGATTGGVAGIGTIQLPQAPPVVFIGTTDVPSENTYRIIEISASKMTLRAGNGSGTIFQFKFVAQ
jgi:PKD repeat protein